MRVLVTGSRTMRDGQFLFDMMDFHHILKGIDLVIEGGAKGADMIAGDWAQKNGVTLAVYPALWEAYGLSAGPRRNSAMLTYGLPNLVLAFVADGSKGTKNMIKQALAANIKTNIYTEDAWNSEYGTITAQ